MIRGDVHLRGTRTSNLGLAVVGVMLLCSGLMGASQAQQEASISALRQRSLELVNEARRSEGLSTLQLGANLNEAAQAHAEDMLERDYYAHVSPEGQTVMDRYKAAGGSENRLVAENIAQCRNCPVPADRPAIEQLHEGWMNSPEHRENLLAEGLTHYGFGLAENEQGTRYGVQTFAGPGTPLGTAGNADPRPLAPPAQTEIAVSIVNERRAAQNVAAISADERLIQAASNVIPDKDLSEVPLSELNSLQEALPAQSPWRDFRMIAGSCGGCGVEPTDADLRYFLDRWYEDPQYRQILQNAALSSMGVAIKADGRGRKIAAAVLAGK